MERVHSKGKYIGRKRKLGKCKGTDRRVWEGIWGKGRRNQVTGARRRREEI